MDGFPNLKSMTVVDVPKSSYSPGLPGQCAFSSVAVYWCVSLNRWLRVFGSLFGVAHDYVSDGDTNGIFYYMGTSFGLSSWVNPYPGVLAITATDNTGGDNKNTITDRAANHYSTAVGSTIVFDLGLGRTVVPTYYSYRYRDDGATFCPTAWKIQGSNDNSAWTDLDTTTGQTPVANAWVSRPLTAGGVSYRYIRYQMTGNNNSGTTQISIGEFELYGTPNF